MYDRVLAHLVARLDADAMDHRQLLVLRSKMAITFYAAYPQRTIQLVLRTHSCVADVIFNFDVDACQFASDGRNVWGTPSALRAVQCGVNYADPERSSPSYEQRLAKYTQRGFAVAVPGLDMELVSKQYTCGVFSFTNRELRKVSLSFGGGEKPTYSVGTSAIVGLPKLLVLSALRATREKQRRARFDPQTHELPDGEGTFLIDLQKLAEYGDYHGEVWHKPTPPTCPPRKVLVGGANATRAGILKDDDYAAVLLPYATAVTQPSQIGDLHNLDVEGEPYAVKVKFCYTFIRDVREMTPGRLGHIEDATMRSSADLSRRGNGYEPLYDLPRYVEFPRSNAPGVANPFARLPEDAWFAGAYDD